jgi:hypothetical protein
MAEEKLRRMPEMKFSMTGLAAIPKTIPKADISREIEVMGSFVEKGSTPIRMMMRIEKVIVPFLMMLNRPEGKRF